MSFEPVNVKNGDEVVDADGNLASLAPGVAVFPHGCTSADCVQVWDGTAPLQMDKLKISFQLKANLKWSDGAAINCSRLGLFLSIGFGFSHTGLKNEIDLTDWLFSRQ